MIPFEYIKQSEITESKFPDGIMLSSEIAEGLHASIGLVTEIIELESAFIELDEVNAKEELGDALWYIAIYARLYNCDMEDFLQVDGDSIFDLVDKSKIIVGNIADFYKKSIFYKGGKRPSLNELMTNVRKLGDVLHTICIFNDWSMQDIMQTNIDKLRERYPDGFNEYDALNRNLDAERVILEK